MKLKLTEEQLKNLIFQLDEQEKPKEGESNIMSDLEKDAPALAAFAKFMKNPVGTAIEKIGGVLSGDESLSSSSSFAANIPPGTELMNPLGKHTKISSGFGPRSIGGSATKNHKGVDLPAASGSPLYAPADGKVITARDTTPNGCGGFIQLDHFSIGLKTKFCHVKKWLVSPGQEVKKGQLIGYSGGAANDPYKGNSMGAHLHYEVLGSNSIAMNPKRVHSDMA
jgi:murein DD-endopeptidase MepM/ murein hydrolase activator NlpD